MCELACLRASVRATAVVNDYKSLCITLEIMPRNEQLGEMQRRHWENADVIEKYFTERRKVLIVVFHNVRLTLISPGSLSNNYTTSRTHDTSDYLAMTKSTFGEIYFQLNQLLIIITCLSIFLMDLHFALRRVHTKHNI